MNNLKEFIIPVTWGCWGVMKIKAHSLEEAEKLALTTHPLPEGNYVDDSIELDKESLDYGKSYEIEEV